MQTDEGPETVTAGLLRTSLGLRSTWITVGVLRLDQPRETTVFSAPLRLGGIARALPAPMLFSSPDGSSWTEVGALQRETSGLASVVVKPERTLRYRIEVAGAASPAVLVQVAPRILLALGVEPMTLSGTVRPRLSGATVAIERREGDLEADRQVDRGSGRSVPGQAPVGARRVSRTDSCDRRLRRSVTAVLDVVG